MSVLLWQTWFVASQHQNHDGLVVAGNIAGMDSKALPGNDSRYVQLKLCLKDTPDILLDHFGNDNKYAFRSILPASDALLLPVSTGPLNGCYAYLIRANA